MIHLLISCLGLNVNFKLVKGKHRPLLPMRLKIPKLLKIWKILSFWSVHALRIKEEKASLKPVAESDFCPWCRRHRNSVLGLSMILLWPRSSPGCKREEEAHQLFVTIMSLLVSIWIISDYQSAPGSLCKDPTVLFSFRYKKIIPGNRNKMLCAPSCALSL